MGFKNYIYVLLYFLLYSTVSCGYAQAISKQQYEKNDTNYILDNIVKNKPTKINNNIYIYSSISTSTFDKDFIKYTISNLKNNKIIPLVELDTYHEIDTSIQSEFLDFTIWGILGNFFNKNIEMAELNNEIIAIFQEIEMINENYNQLLVAKTDRNSKIDALITLNKEKYLEKQTKTQFHGEDDNYMETNYRMAYHGLNIRKRRMPQDNLPNSSLLWDVKRNFNAENKENVRGLRKLIIFLMKLGSYFLHNKFEASMYIVLLGIIITVSKSLILDKK